MEQNIKNFPQIKVCNFQAKTILIWALHSTTRVGKKLVWYRSPSSPPFLPSYNQMSTITTMVIHKYILGNLSPSLLSIHSIDNHMLSHIQDFKKNPYQKIKMIDMAQVIIMVLQIHQIQCNPYPLASITSSKNKNKKSYNSLADTYEKISL